MNDHQKNLQKIKNLTAELAECMKFNGYENFPSPYTAEDDPEVDYVVDRRWTHLKQNSTYPVFKKRRYSQLPYDCKQIVDDIVNSSQLEVFKQWDKNFRRKYYTKAILMAYDLGKENNKNIFTIIRGWFYSLAKYRTHY